MGERRFLPVNKRERERDGEKWRMSDFGIDKRKQNINNNNNNKKTSYSSMSSVFQIFGCCYSVCAEFVNKQLYPIPHPPSPPATRRFWNSSFKGKQNSKKKYGARQNFLLCVCECACVKKKQLFLVYYYYYQLFLCVFRLCMPHPRKGEEEGLGFSVCLNKTVNGVRPGVVQDGGQQ